MTNLRGTNIAAGIVPFTDSDQFATHYAKYGQGGWKAVETLAELDEISIDRLEKGMAVYVTAEAKVYILTDLDLSTTPIEKTWTELETGGSGQTIQVSELPRPSEEIKGLIVEYIGETESGEPEPIITLVNTRDDCEVSIDNSDFRDSLANLIGITVEELDDMSFDLRFHYYANKWWLYDNQLGSTQDLENNWGMTLDYGTGSVHTNDRIYVDWLGNRDPYIVNGYFYQVIDEAIEDGYFGEVTNYTNEFVVNTDIEVYRQFIENQGRILVDMTYQFTYDGSQWLYNNIAPVDLRDYGLEVDYNGGTPTEGDAFTAIYNAEYNQYVWAQKDVQNIKNKIDKFKEFPRATEENEGLIAQYVGETEIEESRLNLTHHVADGADLSISTDKDVFESVISSQFGEEALTHSYEISLEWDANQQLWNYITLDTTTGEQVASGAYPTVVFENFGLYITIDPRPEDLQHGTIIIEYIPEREGEFHNGYFYKSIEEVINENMTIDDINNLELNETNPYDLDVETYKEYVQSQGQTLEDKETLFRYGQVSGGTEGWYDSWNGPWDSQTGLPVEADLENDYGITLHYRETEESVSRDCQVLACVSQNQPRIMVDKIEVDTFINALINNRVIQSEPTKPTSFFIQSYDSNNYRINGVDVGTINNLGSEYGIHLNEITRAPTFGYGDYMTIFFTPQISFENQSSSYLLVGGKFGNPDPAANGGYISDLDVDTFESMIGTIPTDVTYYEWKCTQSGDAQTSTWKLDGASANPADYGIILGGVSSRAPQTPFLTDDSFVVMYRPADKVVFRTVKERWENSGYNQAVEIVSADTFKSNWYADDGYSVKKTLVCSDNGQGSLSNTKWKDTDTSNEYTFQELTDKFGVTLTSPRAPAYDTGDFFAIEYLPVASREVVLPTDQSEFIWNYQARWSGRRWVQVDVQPRAEGTIDYNQLENRPAIDGVTLTSETTSGDLSGSFVDLVSNQTANGTKIINELFKDNSQLGIIITSNEENNSTVDWEANTYLPRDDDTVFWFTAANFKPVTLGFDGGSNVPAFAIIKKSDGSVLDPTMPLYPINPDPNHVVVQNGQDPNKWLGSFTSNVVEWFDERDGKTYLFALSSTILMKIDKSLLNERDYLSATVKSYLLYPFNDWINNKKNLNRLRVFKNTLYAFQEMDTGTSGGCSPVKFDILDERSTILGYGSEWKAGGFSNSWGYNPSKESGHDYQIILNTTDGYEYAYLYVEASRVTNISGNEVLNPNSTIYKFPLNNSVPEINGLTDLGYQFSIRSDMDCTIKKIIKLDERFLIVYAYDNIEKVIVINLFDTKSDSVVDQVLTTSLDASDDYSISKENGIFVVSGFLAKNIYQLKVDTTDADHAFIVWFDEQYSAYLLLSDYQDINRRTTIHLWGIPEIVSYNGHVFSQPFVYSYRQTKRSEKVLSLWAGLGTNLDRYATETYVNSTIASAGFSTQNDLNNLYSNISNNYGVINYYNLYNKPTLNGYMIEANKTSQDYHIIEAYGINITDSQMIMNGKAIKYDTPFFNIMTPVDINYGEIANAYMDIENVIIIPSTSESNVYYLYQNAVRVSDNVDCILMSKLDLNTGTVTPYSLSRFTDYNKIVSCTYDAISHTATFIIKIYNDPQDPSDFIAHAVTLASPDDFNYVRISASLNLDQGCLDGNNLEGLVTNNFSDSQYINSTTLAQHDSSYFDNVVEMYGATYRNGGITWITSLDYPLYVPKGQGFENHSIINDYCDYTVPYYYSTDTAKRGTSISYRHYINNLTFKPAIYTPTTMSSGSAMFEINGGMYAMSSANNHEIFKQNGNTWVSQGSSYANLIGAPLRVVFTGNQNYLYVAMDAKGMYDYSQDGLTWNNIQGMVNYSIADFNYLPSCDCFVALTHSYELLYSFDGMNTWTRVAADIIPSTGNTVGMAFESDEKGIAISSDGYVFAIEIDSVNQTVSLTKYQNTVLLKNFIDYNLTHGSEGTFDSSNWGGIEYFNKQYIAYTINSMFVSMAEDGVSWTSPMRVFEGYPNYMGSLLYMFERGISGTDTRWAQSSVDGTIYCLDSFGNLYKTNPEQVIVSNDLWYSSQTVDQRYKNAYAASNQLVLSTNSEPYTIHGDDCYCGIVGNGCSKKKITIPSTGSGDVAVIENLFVLKGDDKLYLAPSYDLTNQSSYASRNNGQSWQGVLYVANDNDAVYSSISATDVPGLWYYYNTGIPLGVTNYAVTDQDASSYKGTVFTIILPNRDPNDTKQLFGYTVHDGDWMLAGNDGEWKHIPKVKGAVTPTDGLIPLTGDFDITGAKNIELCESHQYDGQSGQFYFYCLITDNSDIKKAYKSEIISLYDLPTSVHMREISADLFEQSEEANFVINYLPDSVFAYSSANFYISNSGVVNFKGDITSLYDPDTSELFTTNPTTGKVVEALDNRNYRQNNTKPGDYALYYYNLSAITSVGDNWVSGVHTVTGEFVYADNTTEEIEITFDISSHHVSQIYNVSKKSGGKPLLNGSCVVTLINPDGTVSSDNATLTFVSESTNTSYLPSIEKFGLVKRGYKVENTVASGAQDTDKVPSVKGMVDYVTQHASSTQVTLLGGAVNWTSNTQTISDVAGVTSSNTILVAPIPTDTSDYTNAGILCSAQGNGTLTFTCTTVPSSSITVNVLTIG